MVTQPSNDTLTTSDLYPPFSPAAHDIRVNCLFFASLACSLLSAGGAVVAKQWLQYYEQTGQAGSKDKQGVLRTEKFLGAQRWRLQQVVDALPILLQLSIVLFFSGLVDYLWTINQQTALVVLVFFALGAIAYSFTTLAAAFSVYCPYQTIPAAYLRFCGRALKSIGKGVALSVNLELSTLLTLVPERLLKRWTKLQGKGTEFKRDERSRLVHAYSARWLVEYSSEVDDIVVAADNMVLLSDVGAVKLVGDNASSLPLIHKLKQSMDYIRNGGDESDYRTPITLAKAVAHIQLVDPLARLADPDLLLQVLKNRQYLASDELKILCFIVSTMATQCNSPTDPVRAAENYPELRMITEVPHDTLLIFLHCLSISNVVPVSGLSGLLIEALHGVFSVDDFFADVRVLSLSGLIISRWFREQYMPSPPWPSWDVRVAAGWEARHSVSLNDLAMNAIRALREFQGLVQRPETPASYESQYLVSFLKHYQQHISSWKLHDTRWGRQSKDGVEVMLSRETANDLVLTLLQTSSAVARARLTLDARSTRNPSSSIAEAYKRTDPVVDDFTLVKLQRRIVVCLDTLILPDDMYHLWLVHHDFYFVQGVLDLAGESDADREVAMQLVHRVLHELNRNDPRLDPGLFRERGTIKLIEEHPSLFKILARGLRATSSESAKVFYKIASNLLTAILIEEDAGAEAGRSGDVVAGSCLQEMTKGTGTSIASLLFEAELWPAFLSWLRVQSRLGLIDNDACLSFWWMSYIVRASDWSILPWADQLVEADLLGVYPTIVAACIPGEEGGGRDAVNTLDSLGQLALTVWGAAVGSRGMDGCRDDWISDTMLEAVAHCIKHFLKPRQLTKTPLLQYVAYAFERRPYSAAAAKLDVALEESLLRISQILEARPSYRPLSPETREREAIAIRRVRASIASWSSFRDLSKGMWWKLGGLAALHRKVELP
ncbi:hypothetical protein FRB94_001117 [Tulasnella sp. JGI-2019a]|nr:hypothetical protein FRB94_001117 [Tulasnella sp. JGI-2019a]